MTQVRVCLIKRIPKAVFWLQVSCTNLMIMKASFKQSYLDIGLCFKSCLFILHLRTDPLDCSLQIMLKLWFSQCWAYQGM